MEMTILWVDRIGWLAAGMLLEMTLHPVERALMWLEGRPWKRLCRWRLL